MPSLHPDPGFDYFLKACRKGDSTRKAVAVGDSAVRVLADTALDSALEVRQLEPEEIPLREVLAAFQRRTAHALS